MQTIIIIGAGLSGAVLAERCATVLKCPVIVIEKRDHIAGNCYDFIDENGIMISKYGAHIFHTNDKTVWDYVNNFSKWVNYEHRVLSSVKNNLVPVPVNITTVNTLLNLNIRTPDEMKEWIDSQTTKSTDILNSEDAALASIGNREIYELMFKNYTYKQWSMWPKDLEPTVLSRIPIRYDFNDKYFNDQYEAIPAGGYTKFVERLVSNPLIKVVLNSDYFDIMSSLPKDHKLIYTGPIDRYFNNKFDKLQYRSLRFEFETLDAVSYQQRAVINYPSLDVPYTRIVEYKKLYQSNSTKTTISKEYPSWEGEPYYPVPTQKNRDLYEKYKREACKLNNVIFAGRLANYKYFNMDQAIRNALDIFDHELKV